MRIAAQFTVLAAALLAAAARAAPPDLDLGGGCAALPSLHTFHATEGTAINANIRVLNSSGGRIFWAFVTDPASASGGAICTEVEHGREFECAAVHIALPQGSPDTAVPDRESARVTGTPSVPGAFRFRAVVATENGSANCEREYLLSVAEANPDTERPTAPEKLTAEVIVPALRITVRLSWQPSTDNLRVVAYLIDRCLGEDCVDFTRIGRSTSALFTDRRPFPETNTRYRVRALDAAGNVSTPSEIASVLTPALGPADHPH
jgi:hypothetical protein